MISRICVLVFLLFPVFVSAQDKILLTNGKVKEGKMLFRNNNSIFYGKNPRQKVDESKFVVIESKYQQKREKVNSDTKKDTLDKFFALELIKANEVRDKAKVRFKTLIRLRTDNVFSVTHPDGKEELIYSPDTLGFLVTDVVEPEVDYTVDEMRRYIYGAQDGMKVKKTAVLLTSVGISTIGSGLGAFFGPIAPATYIIVLGTTKQKPNEAKVSHPEYIQDEAYLQGYKKAARKRKIIAAAEGGLIGLSIGITAYWAIFRGF